MGEQFDRVWQLEVALPGKEGRKWQPPTSFSFSVEQGIGSGMDKLTCTLVNLKKSSVDFLTQEGLRVVLRAGYAGDGMGVIFAGQVSRQGVRTSVVDTQNGTRRETVITAGVGEIDLQQTRFDRSYAAGVTNIQIIRDCASALGVRLRERVLIPTKVFATGWVHSGTVAAALTQLAAAIGSNYMIQGEDLFMLQPSKATREDAVLVSAETGLVGRSIKQTTGIEFKSRLNHRLRPGRKVAIRSRDANGTYKLTKLTHSGNSGSGSGSWESAGFCAFLGGKQS